MTLEQAQQLNSTVFDVTYKYYKLAGISYTYWAKCKGCHTTIKIRNFKYHSGKCSKCSHAKYPLFYRQYKMMFKGKQQVDLSFAEFLEFTQIAKCHYCNLDIKWNSKRYAKGKGWLCYFLDRKDNSQGYTKNNCVVCCTDCNRTKGARYSYEEFMLLSPVLTQIQEARKVLYEQKTINS